jgi:hypothetical protein
MTPRQIAAFLVLWTAWLVSGSDSQPTIRLTTASGVSVPNADDLTRKLEGTFRDPRGTKTYTRENNKWIEVKPSPPVKGLSAVVRSFDRKKGIAYVELMYPRYNMPLVQIWRFNGEAWSDSVDPGIFAR